jgi:hypothetical protein
MAFFQRQNPFYRTIGCHEYGMRDIDLVMVPRMDNYASYESECHRFADLVDRMLNEAAMLLKHGTCTCTYLELS